MARNAYHAYCFSASAVRRIWKAHGLQPHRYRQLKLGRPELHRQVARRGRALSIRRPTPSCCRSMRRAKREELMRKIKQQRTLNDLVEEIFIQIYAEPDFQRLPSRPSNFCGANLATRLPETRARAARSPERVRIADHVAGRRCRRSESSRMDRI